MVFQSGIYYIFVIDYRIEYHTMSKIVERILSIDFNRNSSEKETDLVKKEALQLDNVLFKLIFL